MMHLVGNILRKVIRAASVIALLTSSAYAQLPPVGIELSPDAPQLTPEEREKRQATDDAYKSALKKIPDQKKTADPWGDMRTSPPTSPKTK